MDRPHANSTYRIHNPVGIRILARLGLGLSQLNEHEFRHNFADCVSPLCSCNKQVNFQILNASVDYIIDSDRFNGSLI